MIAAKFILFVTMTRQVGL